jgi:hypothetical protein
MRDSANSFLSALSPRIALDSTRAIATLRNDDPTYGRSLTYWASVGSPVN